MAFDDSHMACHAPKVIRIPADVLVPVHNTLLAAPISDLPLDIIIRSLDDANVHEFALKTLEIMPSCRLHMLFLIKDQDGYQYLLTLSPPAGIRLLRHERWSIRSEAVILQWLSGISRKWKCQTEFKAVNSRAGNTSSKVQDARSNSKPPSLTVTLLDFLPMLIKHGFLDTGEHSFYNISTPSLGTAIWNLSAPLSPAERETIDFQTGQLLRRLSLYHSPNRKFGRAANILPQTISSASVSHHQGSSSEESMMSFGSDKWSEAFHILLESALRDAEDLLLTISYDRIRYQFYRFRKFLDGVTRPCFVAIDIWDDTNTLVQRCDELSERDVCVGGRHEVHSCRKSSNLTGKGGGIRVTGLRDWSHCIFGDPLMASAFSRDPSPDFIRGFHSRLQPAEHGVFDYASNPTEDQLYAHVRLLLYECFHSVVAIAQEGYRWRHDSHTRELAGRKKLLDALMRLERLDDRGNPKHEPPNAETIPAKRTKSKGR